MKKTQKQYNCSAIAKLKTIKKNLANLSLNIKNKKRIKERFELIIKKLNSGIVDQLYFTLLMFSIIEAIIDDTTSKTRALIIKDDTLNRYAKTTERINILKQLAIIDANVENSLLELRKFRDSIHIDKDKKINICEDNFTFEKVIATLDDFINNIIKNTNRSSSNVSNYRLAISSFLYEYDSSNECDTKNITKYLTIHEIKLYKSLRSNKKIKKFESGKYNITDIEKRYLIYTKIFKDIICYNGDKIKYSFEITRSVVSSLKYFPCQKIKRNIFDALKNNAKSLLRMQESIKYFAYYFKADFTEFIYNQLSNQEFVFCLKNESRLRKDFVDNIAYALFQISNDDNFEQTAYLLIKFYELSQSRYCLDLLSYMFDLYFPNTKASLTTRIKTIETFLDPKSKYNKWQQKIFLYIIKSLFDNQKSIYELKDLDGNIIGSKSSYNEILQLKEIVAQSLIKFEHDDETILMLLTIASNFNEKYFVKIITLANSFYFRDISFENKASSIIYKYYLSEQDSKGNKFKTLKKYLNVHNTNPYYCLSILFNESYNNNTLRDEILDYIYSKSGRQGVLNFSKHIFDSELISKLLYKKIKRHSYKWITDKFKRSNENQQKCLANYALIVNDNSSDFLLKTFKSLDKIKDKINLLIYPKFNRAVLQIVLTQSKYIQRNFWKKVALSCFASNFSDKELQIIVDSLLGAKRVITALRFVHAFMFRKKRLKLYDLILKSLPGKDIHLSKEKNSIESFLTCNNDINLIEDTINQLKKAKYNTYEHEVKLNKIKQQKNIIDVSEDEIQKDTFYYLCFGEHI